MIKVQTDLIKMQFIKKYLASIIFKSVIQISSTLLNSYSLISDTFVKSFYRKKKKKL